MLYILYAIFFIACITLIGSVLLQPGKTDAGALFTCNVSSSAFAPRGTASVLSKVTIVAAAAFMISALFIGMPAFNGNVSVLQSATEEKPVDAPAEVPVSANTNTSDAVNAPVANTNAASVELPAANADVPAANSANTSPANK